MFVSLKNRKSRTMTLLTGFMAAITILCVTSCDDNQGIKSEDSDASNQTSSVGPNQTSSPCPTGQISKDYLSQELEDASGSHPSFFSGMMGVGHGTRPDGDSCLGIDEASRVVAEGLPHLHKEIDDHNNTLDRHAADVDMKIREYKSIADPRARVRTIVMDSCASVTPPLAREYPSYSYRWNQFWSTTITDSSKETVQALIDEYAAYVDSERYYSRDTSKLPIHGKRGWIDDQFGAYSKAYQDSWKAAYEGSLPEMPYSFDAARTQVCG